MTYSKYCRAFIWSFKLSNKKTTHYNNNHLAVFHVSQAITFFWLQLTLSYKSNGAHQIRNKPISGNLYSSLLSYFG